MSTSLGRLVLDVAANAAGFERDMQRVSKSAKKELGKVQRDLRFAQRDLDAARARVTRLAGAFTALGAVGLAVAVRQISEFRKETDQLSKTSRVVGVTVEQLQELRFAAETAAGVAGNQLDVALQRFARRAGEAANGSGELVKAFNQLGISARDQNGNIKTQVQLLKEFADGVSQAGSQQEQLALAFKAFDSEGARLVNLLRLGSAGIEQLGGEFAATGNTISNETAEAVERFNDALGLLVNQFAAFRNNLLSDIIEPLADFADFLARSEQGQELVRRTLVQLGEAAKVVGVVIGVGFVAAFAKATVAVFTAEVRVGSLTAKMLALQGATGKAAAGAVLLGRTISLATGPIGILITIIGTLVFAFQKVQSEIENTSEDFDEFKQRIDAAAQSSARFSAAQLEGDLLRIGARISEINEELENLETDQVSLELSGDLGAFSAEQGRQRIQALREEKKKLTDSAEVLSGRLNSLSEQVEETGDSAVSAKDNFDILITALNEFAQEAAEDAISQAREMADAIADLNDEIADAAAEFGGPFAKNVRNFQKEVQRIAQLPVPEALKAERIQQLRREFEETNEELGDGLIDTLQDAISGAIPSFIAGMLGIESATRRAGNSFGALNQIGQNFATAVLNGQGIQNALGSSLTAFGGQGIGNALDSTDLAGFFKTAFTEGVGAALEGSEFKKNSAAGFALALGQAVEGNIGQAAFTAIGNALGGEIGALIGSIIGDLVFGESVPKFQVRGVNSNTATDAGTDRVINTAFGADLEIAFRGIEDTAKRQIVRGYSEFLSALSGVVRDPGQQSAIAQVISEFGVSSRSGPDDLEGQLELLFDDILGTFDSFTQGFVRQAETLDGQVQRLDDILRLSNLDTLGRNFGLTFEELATVLDDVAIGGESIIATFNRLEGVIASLDQVAALTGNSIADTREGIIRFGADLVALFGDDAGVLSGQLDRAIGAIFSDAEISQQQIASSRQRISDLLTSIGVEVTESAFSEEGFRDIFTALFGNLSPEDTAALIEAGAAFADLIDAEEELARVRGESADGLASDFQRAVQSIADALDQQLIGPASSLTPQEQLNVAESQLRQAVAQAQEGDLAAAQDIPALFQQAIGLGAGFFGTSTAGFAAFEGDLRSLLEGLELEGFSVAEAQLTKLQEIADTGRQQVELLSQIAGIESNSAGSFAAPVVNDDRESAISNQIEILNGKIDLLNAKTDTANEDRRTAAEAQVDEIGLTREQLALLRRDTDTSLRPRIIRQSLR